MARIRTIKPDFWTDEDIVECSVSARLFFIGLLNFADDNGNLVYSAKKLKMQIFPGDSFDCEPLIYELITHGLLIEYSVNGERFLNIKGFKRHQVINRRSKTSIPEPDFSDKEQKTGNDHHPLTEDSLTEGNGKEGNSKGEDITTIDEAEECARDDSSSSFPENPPIPENLENPIPDEAPTRPAQIAVLIRRNGACHRTHAGDKGVIELANLNATDTEILNALETAKRQRKDAGSSQPITASYLVPIVKDQRTAKPAGSGKYDKDLADMAAMNAWADEQILAETQAAQHPATPALEGE